MSPGILKNRQLLGSFFAIMIMLFSMGTSYAQTKGKVTEPEQVTLSAGSSARVASQNDQTTDSFLFFNGPLASGYGMKSMIISNLRPSQFHKAEALIEWVIFFLPDIHAP